MDYKKYKLTDLVEMLRARRLPTSGLKKDVILRLEEHDANNSDHPTQAGSASANFAVNHLSNPSSVDDAANREQALEKICRETFQPGFASSTHAVAIRKEYDDKVNTATKNRDASIERSKKKFDKSIEAATASMKEDIDRLHKFMSAFDELKEMKAKRGINIQAVEFEPIPSVRLNQQSNLQVANTTRRPSDQQALSDLPSHSQMNQYVSPYASTQHQSPRPTSIKRQQSPDAEPESRPLSKVPRLSQSILEVMARPPRTSSRPDASASSLVGQPMISGRSYRMASPTVRQPLSERSSDMISALAASNLSSSSSSRNSALLPNNYVIETDPIRPQLSRNPYIFIPSSNIPLKDKNTHHMREMMRFNNVKNVRADLTGYFVIFEGNEQGNEQAHQCYQKYRMTKLTRIWLEMQLFPLAGMSMGENGGSTDTLNYDMDA